MGWYIFDTNALRRWDALPAKWARYRREFERGRSRIVLFEALLFEAASVLAVSAGGEGSARQRLVSILASEQADFRALSTGEIIEGAFAAARLRSLKGWRQRNVSLVDKLCLHYAGIFHGKIVTFDRGLRDSARLMGVAVDWLPLA
jgi:predicted nucleic acid-binding protein